MNFTFEHSSTDTNDLIHTNKANCAGYSTMFNSIANHLILNHRLEGEIKANHKIGKLVVFGKDIHQYFKSSFFKDHDFNELRNISTGKSITIDPRISDYLWIDKVKKKNKEA